MSFAMNYRFIKQEKVLQTTVQLLSVDIHWLLGPSRLGPEADRGNSGYAVYACGG